MLWLRSRKLFQKGNCFVDLLLAGVNERRLLEQLNIVWSGFQDLLRSLQGLLKSIVELVDHYQISLQNGIRFVLARLFLQFLYEIVFAYASLGDVRHEHQNLRAKLFILAIPPASEVAVAIT